MDFKDLFSTQAADYAQFRPYYPPALFDYLASLPGARELAWDCGTGNGQAAVEIARRFTSVVATDPSERQLAGAAGRPNLSYLRGTAERAPLADASVDLVTAAQAFHWFNPAEFFREARRVLKPDGALAIWSYDICRITPALDEVLRDLYAGILAGYWENERRLVEEGYRNSPFPLRELAVPAFGMRAQWTLAHLRGYLGTWSDVQTYIRRQGRDPVDEVLPRLTAAWGETFEREVSWHLSVRAGRF